MYIERILRVHSNNLNLLSTMKTTRNKFAFFGFILLSFTLGSCSEEMWGIKGEGPIVEEERSLEAFHSISNSITAKVYLEQVPQEEVRIEAQENMLANLLMEVENGTLRIGWDENVRSHDGITIYITIPEVKELKLSGSGEIIGRNTIKGASLEVNISGSGEANLTAEVEEVEGAVSGSGELVLKGQSEELGLRVSGSGEINALEMETAEAEVQVSGSGDCFVNVRDYLQVSISGSGDVGYKGQPEVDSSISGSGDLRKL